MHICATIEISILKLQTIQGWEECMYAENVFIWLLPEEWFLVYAILCYSKEVNGGLLLKLSGHRDLGLYRVSVSGAFFVVDLDWYQILSQILFDTAKNTRKRYL